MHARLGTRPDQPEPQAVEHGGATWSRVASRSLTTSFYWAGDVEMTGDGGTSEGSVYVEARVRALTAKGATVTLNGKVVGGWRLTRGQTRVVVARGGGATLIPGPNELTVRLVGGTGDALAEIDWIHVGTGEPTEAYAAPTREDALLNATVGGISRRALAIRAPGFVRCNGWLPASATLHAFVALAGSGEGDVQFRVLRDRTPPDVVGSAHLTAHTWTEVSVPVRSDTGFVGAVDLVGVRAPRGARVLFAEAKVLGTAVLARDEPLVAARSVVVVVLGSVASRTLGLYGGARPVPELTALASAGVLFEAHRATGPFANGGVASMLTGLAARAHAVEDPDARLPRPVRTVVDAARQAGVATAMFTANPTTGPAFGFDRGWDTYQAHTPLDDGAATQVFDDATRWIEEHRGGRFLVVVHARGGHPPWDATPDELRLLPPAEYTGTLEPRRAAELLAKARRVPQRFTDADRTRAWALYGNAVDAHDAALGRLLTYLRATGRERDTAVVVVGDVGVQESALAPFLESEALDEAMLATPLVVRAPGLVAGQRVATPTSHVDLGRTFLGLLGLTPPSQFQGTNVLTALGYGAGAGEAPGLIDRPLVASGMGRFSARWGPFVLVGTVEKFGKLCDLSLEPACVTDVRRTYPLAVDVLQAVAVDAMARPRGPRLSREPAFLDPGTMAALTAWGRLAEKATKGRHAEGER